MEDVVSERCKTCAAAHRSDEGRQAYISALRNASPVIAKAKTKACMNLNLCILSFVLSLALFSHFPSILSFPTVPLPGSQLWSSPIT